MTLDDIGLSVFKPMNERQACQLSQLLGENRATNIQSALSGLVLGHKL